MAWGFSANQLNGNFAIALYNAKGNPPWTTNGNGDTAGWIGYVNTGRYNAKAGVFPTTVVNNANNVTNPFAAGTFKWIEGPFGVPEPSSILMALIGGMCVATVYGWRKCRAAIA